MFCEISPLDHVAEPIALAVLLDPFVDLGLELRVVLAERDRQVAALAHRHVVVDLEVL